MKSIRSTIPKNMAEERKSIRFGILGSAEIARKVSRAINLSPNATLYATGSRSLEKATNFASSNGFPSHVKVYGSYDAVLDDPEVDTVHATLSYRASPHFLENDIRVKPDLDALGALGDTGWYCIRAILWATNYELPKITKALRKPTYNEAGVILSCEASLLWDDHKVATFYCSFLSNTSMDIIAIGTKGSLRVHDYVIPNEEKESLFYTNSNSYFVELSTGWGPKPKERKVHNELPQEAIMVEFANLVEGIKFGNLKVEKKWPSISRKTQVVVDAVKASIDNGLKPVHIKE